MPSSNVSQRLLGKHWWERIHKLAWSVGASVDAVDGADAGIRK
jgi:DMSO/TMAO reductase YedYZ heme-binding membrane subunit